MLACLNLFFHGFDKKDISFFNDQNLMVTNQLYLFFFLRFSCYKNLCQLTYSGQKTDTPALRQTDSAINTRNAWCIISKWDI